MAEAQPYDVVRECPGVRAAALSRARRRRDAGEWVVRRRRKQVVHAVLQEADLDTERGADRYVVSFVMPADLDLDRTPDPTDPDVRIRRIPAQTAAALKFSGRWSRGRYEEHARRLLAAVHAAGLEVDGPLRFARFDPPWTPWFLRHHEVVAPVVPPAA